MTMAKFRETSPNVDWATYLKGVDVTVSVAKVNVAEPAFFKRLDALIANTPLDDWKAYLRYHALSSSASYLSKPFVDENFAFNSHFSGAKELLPRWKRCARTTDGLIGEALGEAYVAKTFSPQARARATAVINDIRAAFGERLKKLDWMSDATKKAALDKLAKMHEKVGYPDKWRDYTALEVTDGPFVVNVVRANTFEWQRRPIARASPSTRPSGG